MIIFFYNFTYIIYSLQNIFYFIITNFVIVIPPEYNDEKKVSDIYR